MDKLPPLIVTAGVVALGASFNVMEELPLEILLIPVKFLFNLTVNVSVPSATTAILSFADSNLVVPSDNTISFSPVAVLITVVPSLVPSP